MNPGAYRCWDEVFLSQDWSLIAQESKQGVKDSYEKFDEQVIVLTTQCKSNKISSHHLSYYSLPKGPSIRRLCTQSKNQLICFEKRKFGKLFDYLQHRTLLKITIYANLVILATPVRIIDHQVVCLGHLGGFVAF